MSTKGYMETKRVELTVKTPLTIKSDESLSPQDYIFDKGGKKLYLLNQREWYKALYEKKLLNQFEADFAKPQGLRKSMYQWAQDLFEKDNLQGSDLSHIAKSIIAVSPEASSQRNSLNSVNPYVRLSDGKPYIPGSSLKGSLDTAILVSMLNAKKSYRQKILSKVEQFVHNYNPRIYYKVLENNIYKLAGDCEKILQEMIHKELMAEYTIDRSERETWNLFFHGLSVGDAIPRGEVKTSIIPRYDYSPQLGKGFTMMPVYYECVLPEAVFESQISIDPLILQCIGVESVEDLVYTSTDWTDQLGMYLQRAFPSEELEGCFTMLDSINILVGGNIGFLHKTIWLAAAADNPRLVTDCIKIILKHQFGKHKHEVDRHVSPRALTVTKWRGSYVLFGGLQAKVLED